MGQLQRIDQPFHASNDLVTPQDAVAIVKQRLDILRAVHAEVLKEGTHFGTITGTQKPTLLKPGAEALCAAFGVTPTRTDTQTRYLDRGHIDVVVTVTLVHVATGAQWATAVGSASTMESKHRWRIGKRCPACDHTLRLDRDTGGWYCWTKNGGCGAKWGNHQEEIKSQPSKFENPDIADCYNTVRKIAWKRAFLAATLTATCASEHFTQDQDEFPTADKPEPRQDVPKPSQARPQNQREFDERKALAKRALAQFQDLDRGRQDSLRGWWESEHREQLPKFYDMSIEALKRCLGFMAQG